MHLQNLVLNELYVYLLNVYMVNKSEHIEFKKYIFSQFIVKIHN